VCCEWLKKTIKLEMNEDKSYNTVRHKSILIHFQGFHLRDHRNSMNKAWKGVWVAVVMEI